MPNISKRAEIVTNFRLVFFKYFKLYTLDADHNFEECDNEPEDSTKSDDTYKNRSAVGTTKIVKREKKHSNLPLYRYPVTSCKFLTYRLFWQNILFRK